MIGGQERIPSDSRSATAHVEVEMQEALQRIAAAASSRSASAQVSRSAGSTVARRCRSRKPQRVRGC